MTLPTHHLSQGNTAPSSRLGLGDRFWAVLVLEVLGVWGVLAVHGSWPAPEVNETHYLVLAKHYWQPDWLAGDFFLETGQTHVFFYLAVGWLASLFPLPAAAWTGRCLAWLLLAIGWSRFSRAVVPCPGVAVLSAAAWLGLMEQFHMAGEWVVGGVEAKTFAYAFVFLALREILDCRWNAGGILLGVAILWHALVGGWAAIAAAFLWLLAGAGRPALWRLWPGLIFGGLLAVIGIWPSLQLSAGADSATASEAYQIYVHRRLPHHLDFLGIKPEFRWRFLGLSIAWLAVATLTNLIPGPSADANRRIGWLQTTVTASLLLVAVGLTLTFLPFDDPGRRSGLLRFYWFRLADTLVPAGISLGVCYLGWTSFSAWRNRFFRVGMVLVAVAGVIGYLSFAAWDRVQQQVPRSYKLGEGQGRYQQWQEVCLWIRRNLPKDAVVITPRAAQDFRWHAQRSDVVNWKDIPQDAAGTVQWWKRLEDVHGDRVEGGFVKRLSRLSPQRLTELGRRYGGGYLLTRSGPPLPFEVLFHQDDDRAFTLYRLPVDDVPAGPAEAAGLARRESVCQCDCPAR